MCTPGTNVALSSFDISNLGYQDIPSTAQTYGLGFFGGQELDLANMGEVTILDKSQENDLLRKLFDNPTEVEAFAVSFPRVASENNGRDRQAMCYDTTSCDAVMATLLYSVKSPAFQHLVDLRLAIPGTHDIRLLAAGMSETVKR
ncbi:hypothetical protein F5Y16DRAFT_422850 [Xylariaceae sp. FL0255]|nr:hypothetical protein F5Y16DRAFT_422850 [Xylariaceae sp. FL0255]